MQSVLVLNADWQPINVTNLQRAIRLILAQRVEVIENYDDMWLNSATAKHPAPSVIRLKTYVNKPHFDITLSKSNIHKRDDHTCQYCGCRVDKPTVDHVIPKKFGGQSTWENLVTCCYSCNNKKGHKTLAEVGFDLMRIPKKPGYSAIFGIKGKYMKRDSWSQYLPN
jgi:5-methylcytosine-specific restriction endonuclease McrA